MVSLTTVYLVSVILTSIAGIGSAFAAKKVTGGAVPIEPLKQEQETPQSSPPEPDTQEEKQELPQPSPPEPPTQEEINNLSERIKNDFGMDQEFADSVMEFIKTPVTSWRDIASDQSELRRKFMKTLTHPNLSRCPQSLLRVCDLVSKKYSNMKDFIEGNDYMNFGDQTADAISLL